MDDLDDPSFTGGKLQPPRAFIKKKLENSTQKTA
jgi:hypothetical protein